MARAFVIRPFNLKKDSSGKELNFEKVHNELIEPCLNDTNFDGSTTGEIIDSGNIREDMFALILEADLVICDITINNANVFYELGIRHALRKKRTIMIKGEPTADGTPFDLLTDRYFTYKIDNPASAKNALIQTIRATMITERETDSPIFQMLPMLKEADPSSNQVVPLDFREEIDRAVAAKSKGWLRVLSHEVSERRFKWTGLRFVGEAQWDLKDYEGARESYELIREIHPDDTQANLALANIYERLYRSHQDPSLLIQSDHAIERVLKGKETIENRIEALALKGRNQKTRWRLEWEKHNSLGPRRSAAINQALRASYIAYNEAFNQDLNHFYSGLNTMQMGEILLSLSSDSEDRWKSTFDSDHEADTFSRMLITNVENLRVIVPMSIKAGLAKLNQKHPNYLWAQISAADALFLTEKNPQRVINRYQDAIPLNKPFAWDATRGQLQLFADLGIKADLAYEVISTIDARFKDSVPKTEHNPHIIIFAGHGIDTPDRTTPRFPAQKENQARGLIMDVLKTIADQTPSLLGLASAVPGSDILFHEICDELKIPSKICLPMPANTYAGLVFNNMDNWRSRFLDLQKNHEVLILSDREGLPGWLQDAGMNPWERGNHWVLQMALTMDSQKVTLVTLWDGKTKGDAPGGTAHFVDLAEKTGKIYIEKIDALKLLT